MDGNGVWRFPGGSGRQGRMERYCLVPVVYPASLKTIVDGDGYQTRKGIVAMSSVVPRQRHLVNVSCGAPTTSNVKGLR